MGGTPSTTFCNFTKSGAGPDTQSFLCVGFFNFFFLWIIFSFLLLYIYIWLIFILLIFVVYKNFLYLLWSIYFNDFANMEYYETSSGAILEIANIIRRYFPWKSIFYDLGSSRGSVLFPLSKLVPGSHFVGVENIAFQVKFCRFLQKFWFRRKNLQFIQEDFFTVDISWTDMLFLYVPRILLPNLKKLLQTKMNNKQILILYRISFKDWTPIEIIPTDFVNGISQNNIYIYQNT